jgi:phosphatidate cytidylyltransferase
MLTRVITSVLAIPILLFFVAIGGIWMKAALCVLTLIALYEFYHAFSPRVLPVHVLGYAFTVILFFFLDVTIPTRYILAAFMVFLLCLFVMLVLFYRKMALMNTLVTFFGVCYISVLFSPIYVVRMSQNGGVFVWLIFISAFMCDTGAYFVGIKFGRHKLVPKLSPKKTIEGAVGGVVSAALGALAYGFLARGFFTGELFTAEHFNAPVFCLITGSIAAVFAQFGDLTASAIKRYAGIKDFGSILPGHGGILDRFDSVLFTSPVVYMMILFLPAA